MALQHQIYTAAVAGQVVTLTPKTGSESKPTHLGATTVVFNTTANPAPTEFFDALSDYLVTLEKLTKT